MLPCLSLCLSFVEATPSFCISSSSLSLSRKTSIRLPRRLPVLDNPPPDGTGDKSRSFTKFFKSTGDIDVDFDRDRDRDCLFASDGCSGVAVFIDGVTSAISTDGRFLDLAVAIGLKAAAIMASRTVFCPGGDKPVAIMGFAAAISPSLSTGLVPTGSGSSSELIVAVVAVALSVLLLMLRPAFLALSFARFCL